jgi:hypothetical protein
MSAAQLGERATRRPAPRPDPSPPVPTLGRIDGESGRGSGSGLRRGEAGIVTLEVALMMFALAFFLTASLTALATGVDHVRCAEAARVGARLAARDEPQTAVVAGALDNAPRGSRVQVTTSGGRVTVTVRAPERSFFSRLGIHVAGAATSVAPIEWTNDG